MKTKYDGINPALESMITRGLLGDCKIRELIRLKQIVDRFALAPYRSQEEVHTLKEQYGVEPDVISWSDYFQTEIASQFHHVSDDEFVRIVDTVRFDLISASLIFTGKPKSFIDRIDSEGIAVYELPRKSWSADQEEAAHLFILKNYFVEMKLHENRICAEDRAWFDEFVPGSQIAAG